MWKGKGRMSDSELRDVAWEVRQADLEQLYIGLGISATTVETAKFSEVNPDVRFKAYSVLKEWRTQNGTDASKAAVLTALWRCNCIDAMQLLQSKWGLWVPNQRHELTKGVFTKIQRVRKKVHVEMHHFDQQHFNIFHSILYDLQITKLASKYRLIHQICFCHSRDILEINSAKIICQMYVRYNIVTSCCNGLAWVCCYFLDYKFAKISCKHNTAETKRLGFILFAFITSEVIAEPGSKIAIGQAG